MNIFYDDDGYFGGRGFAIVVASLVLMLIILRVGFALRQPDPLDYVAKPLPTIVLATPDVAER